MYKRQKYTLHGKNIVHITSGTDELHFFYDAQNRPAVVVYNGIENPVTAPISESNSEEGWVTVWEGTSNILNFIDMEAVSYTHLIQNWPDAPSVMPAKRTEMLLAS